MKIEVFQTIESRSLAYCAPKKIEEGSIIQKSIHKNLDTLLKIDLKGFTFSTGGNSDGLLHTHKVTRLDFSAKEDGEFETLNVFISTKIPR